MNLLKTKLNDNHERHYTPVVDQGLLKSFFQASGVGIGGFAQRTRNAPDTSKKNHHSTLPNVKYSDTDRNPSERIQLLPPARCRWGVVVGREIKLQDPGICVLSFSLLDMRRLATLGPGSNLGSPKGQGLHLTSNKTDARTHRSQMHISTMVQKTSDRKEIRPSLTGAVSYWVACGNMSGFSQQDAEENVFGLAIGSSQSDHNDTADYDLDESNLLVSAVDTPCKTSIPVTNMTSIVALESCSIGWAEPKRCLE
ncbi:hypothetical protein Moror_5136 [Moniliophthora roreri MCA 2997]|uniref:Uncharacterized protein n=1 Tax=Moniliophthora roreri (strain MCA 2997) TaxID=1381753 RepID=V2X8X9_MONRO|nr:hypothetical protein Moror_5136 [Moniliophthora roreri MCA 2997]